MKKEEVLDWAKQMQEYGTREKVCDAKRTDEDWYARFASHLAEDREETVSGVLEVFSRAIFKTENQEARLLLASTILEVAHKEGHLSFGGLIAEDIKTPEELIAHAEETFAAGDKAQDLLNKIFQNAGFKPPYPVADQDPSDSSEA